MNGHKLYINIDPIDKGIRALTTAITFRAVADWYISKYRITNIINYIKAQNWDCFSDDSKIGKLIYSLDADEITYDDILPVWDDVYTWYRDRRSRGNDTIARNLPLDSEEESERKKKRAQVKAYIRSFESQCEKSILKAVENDTPLKNIVNKGEQKLLQFDNGIWALALMEKPCYIWKLIENLRDNYEMLDDCEKFFVSSYGEQITGIHGHVIIESINKNWENGSWKDVIYNSGEKVS